MNIIELEKISKLGGDDTEVFGKNLDNLIKWDLM